MLIDKLLSDFLVDNPNITISHDLDLQVLEEEPSEDSGYILTGYIDKDRKPVFTKITNYMVKGIIIVSTAYGLYTNILEPLYSSENIQSIQSYNVNSDLNTYIIEPAATYQTEPLTGDAYSEFLGDLFNIVKFKNK